MKEYVDEKSPLLSNQLTSPFAWVMNYLPSCSTLGYGGAAVLVTLPFLPYVFSPTPESINEEWWSNLTLNEQLLMGITATIFLVEGTVTRFHYLQDMVSNLKKMFSNFCQNAGNIFSNTMTLLVSVIAGVPSGALGYFGALWAGKILASLSGLLSYLFTISLRIALLPNFINEIKDIFNRDRLFQKQIIHYLKLLKHDKREPFEKTLRNNMQEWGKTDIDEAVIQNLLDAIFIKSHADCLFNTVTIPQKIYHVLKTGFAALAATTVASAFILFIGQASYEGFRLLYFTFTRDFGIDFWPYMAKLGLISLPGLLAGAILISPVFKFINELIEDVFHHIQQNPFSLIKLIIIFSCCSLTAFSMQNAAKGLAAKPDDLFELDPENNHFWSKLYYQLYALGNYGASWILDMSACIKLSNLDKNIDPKPNLNKSIEWLRKNPLSKETVNALQQNSFFSQPITSHNTQKKHFTELTIVTVSKRNQPSPNCNYF